MATHNYGIMNTGKGTITASQMAVGNNAIAVGSDINSTVQQASKELHERGLVEMHQKLESLLQAVQDCGDNLKSREQILDATKSIADEFLKEKPNKIILKALLNDITSEAQSVESVVSAAGALKAEVDSFL